jgi:hypothetical protein
MNPRRDDIVGALRGTSKRAPSAGLRPHSEAQQKPPALATAGRAIRGRQTTAALLESLPVAGRDGARGVHVEAHQVDNDRA